MNDMNEMSSLIYFFVCLYDYLNKFGISFIKFLYVLIIIKYSLATTDNVLIIIFWFF